MEKKVRCRVCGEYIGFMGWNKHVEAHKRKFCRTFGINVDLYWKIKWETVVEQFNPTEVKQQPEPRVKPQKSLEAFL